MAPFILNRFCCWNLEDATRGAGIYQLVAGTIALFLVILDVVATGVDGFEIQGGFASWWRVLIWKEWLACNIVMMCAHVMLLILSVMFIYTIRPSNIIYKRLPIMKAWFWLMICYMITEVAIGTYQYSWYGKNSFRREYLCFTIIFFTFRMIVNRRPYLCFTIFFFAIRMTANIMSLIVVKSRIEEIREILHRPVEKSTSQQLYPLDYHDYPYYDDPEENEKHAHTRDSFV